MTATLGMLCWIASRARRAPARPDPIVKGIGKVLQHLATGSFIGSVGSYSYGYTHRDSCGQVTGLSSDLTLWLLLASATLFIVGLTMTTTSEWAAILSLATVDLGLATVFAWVPIPHRRQLITLLMVHGICTAVAGWWSWRVHLGTPTARARGSEAGRTLVAGWIVLLTLQVGLSDELASARSAADTQFLALFIVTAISIVMGTGYTKYVEARDMLTADQQPSLSKTRRRGAAVAEWGSSRREWSTRYREFF